MRHCKYCASTTTHLDQFSYCKRYNCFSRSGKQLVLDNLIKEARTIYTMPDTYGQIGRVVSNPFSHRHRFANDIIDKAKKQFDGLVPLELLTVIPDKYCKLWDKNIRW